MGQRCQRYPEAHRTRTLNTASPRQHTNPLFPSLFIIGLFEIVYSFFQKMENG